MAIMNYYFMVNYLIKVIVIQNCPIKVYQCYYFEANSSFKVVFMSNLLIDYQVVYFSKVDFLYYFVVNYSNYLKHFISLKYH